MNRVVSTVSATRPFGRALAIALLVGGCQPESHDLISVVVSLPDQRVPNAAKATLVVDYSRTDAKIASEGGTPACAFILPGVEGDFSDDREGTLTIRTRGPRALKGPADIVACRMKADGETTSAALHDRLSVKITSAEDATGKVIDVSAKANAGAASPERTEAAIEAAQAEAVRAAAAAASASAAASPPVATTGPQGVVLPGSPGVPPGVVPGGPGAIPANPFNAGAAASGAGMAAPGAAGAAGTRPTPPPFSRPLATPQGNAGFDAGAGGDVGPGGNDGMAGNDGNTGGVPGNDGDPSYDDSCDPLPPASTIEIEVSTNVGRLGALQLEVTHLGRSGCFIGRGDQVECAPVVDALVAANYPGERTAKIGLISLQGINTPGPVMRCGFRTKESLSDNSFTVTVTDASSPGGEPSDPPPEVRVARITRR